MVKRGTGSVDGHLMESRRELTSGWVETTARIALQAIGWMLLAVGVVAVAAGLITGPPWLSAVGFVAAFGAWWISGALPEPAPAPTRPAARRLAVLAKRPGHQLPA